MVADFDIGHSLNARVAGTGRRAVVLESGAGVPGSRAWEPVVELLCDRCQVLSYDRPGGVNRVEVLSTVAEEAFGAGRRAVLVGWSLGALIVQAFALRHPDRAAALVLIEPTPPEMVRPLPLIQLSLPEVVACLGHAAARSHLLRDSAAWSGLRQDTEGLADFAAGVLSRRESLRGVPTVVITADRRGRRGRQARIRKAHEALAHELDGALWVAPTTRHNVPAATPATVAAAILQVAGQA